MESLLATVIEEIYAAKVHVSLEHPTDQNFGDYTTNIAMVLAKQISVNPREIAAKVAESLQQRGKGLGIEKVEVAGPGFLNIFLSNQAIINYMSKLLEDAERIAETNKSKKYVIEYSSPNIAKPFTIGHLRSSVIGDAIANLLEATGATVYRDNHIGDWGTQFGKQIYALLHLGEGNLEANIQKIESAERPVEMLVQLYVEFHEKAEQDAHMEEEARGLFKKLEEGDPDVRALWQKCIDWSWKVFKSIYKELHVPSTPGKEFENNGRGYGEAFFEDKMATVVEELEEKGLLKEGNEGAKIVEFPEQTALPPLMIIKKDGATLYSTRDLATDKFRMEQYGKDITIINEVGAEQSLYFKQLYLLEEMLGWYNREQRVHVKHGLYRFKEGKMSTRKGNVIWLEEVLAEAKKRAEALIKGTKETDESEENEKTFVPFGSSGSLANSIAVGAIKWNDLKRSSHEDIAFDWDTVLSMEGNSGPYIQYTYARTQSVLAKAKGVGQRAKSNILEHTKHYALSPLLVNEEAMLLHLLYRFGEVVVEAAEKYSPNILANYLFQLAQQYNVFYQKIPILKSEGQTREYRLWLNEATGIIIKRGLGLLGIQAPDKM